MPNFSNQPPDDLGRSGYRLIRTPAAAPLIAHVLSENVLGCPTHWTGNRTVPCEGDACDQCAAGLGWRWHGYLAIQVDNTQETVLFEFTAKASAAFAAYHERHQTLRGAHIKATRQNNRSNGRVLIQARPVDLSRIRLPKAPPVEQILCHIWNVPPNQIVLPDAKPRPPFQAAQLDRTRPDGVIPITDPDHVAQAIELAAARARNNRPNKPH